MLASSIVNPDLEAKLAEALAADVDCHGGDPALAVWVAEMSQADKEQSRRNIEASIAKLRSCVVKKPSDDPSSDVCPGLRVLTDLRVRFVIGYRSD
jgi:hypothetical protein